MFYFNKMEAIYNCLAEQYGEFHPKNISIIAEIPHVTITPNI